MKNSLRAEIAQAREPSPLDFIFDADRQEKAKRNQGDVLGTPPANGTQSSSPWPSASRSHSRHPTGGSIFPMEMENTAPPKTPNDRRADASPHFSSPDQNVTDKARAKTEALKQLLQFGPRPNSSPLSQSASIAQVKPMSSSQAPTTQARRTHSGNSTPLSHIDHGNSPARTQGPFQPPPRPSLSPQGREGPQTTRSYSSSLRHEVAHDTGLRPAGNQPTSVFDLAPSSTATPPLTSISPPARTSQPNVGAHGSNRSGPAPSNLSSLQSMTRAEQDAMLHATLARHVNPSTGAIEDELRKILKISPLPTGTSS